MAAKPLIDSSGKMTGVPVFEDDADTYEATSIKYNFKTKKGYIEDIVTKQGEGYISGGPVKKDEDALYIKSAQYTTCNLRHPHFYIKARNLKMIPNDKVVSGPFNLVVSDVPTPLGFYLGFFPIQKLDKKKSGIIFPTFGANTQRGFFITQGGYYWAMNDYVGIKLVGDAYGNGSWRANSIVDYKKRYGFGGNVSLSISKVKNSFNENERPIQDFQVRWEHTSVPKNNSSFNARVSMNSQKYFANNSFNPTSLQSNGSISSVTYTKSFGSLFNITVAVRQDQNVRANKMVMNFTLPEVNFGVNRIYPFKQKLGTSQKWFEKINMSYNFNIKNQATNLPFTYGYAPANFTEPRDTINLSGNNSKGEQESNFNFLDSLRKTLGHGMIGAKHTIPIATTMKVLKYFNLNPSLNYNEYWYDRKLKYRFDDASGKLIVSDSSGFYRTADYNLTTSLTTSIYGRYSFKGQILQGILHTIRPALNYNFHPDFSKNQPLSFENITRIRTSSRSNYESALSNYNGFFFGAPSAGKMNSLGFSIQNAIEAKVRNRKDTANPIKKINLIDNLNASGYYNFAADSLKLSLINLSLRTTLFNKININIGSNYDPYYFRLDSVLDGQIYQTRVDSLRSLRKRKTGSGETLYKGSQSFQVSISVNLNPKARNNGNAAATQQQKNFMNANPNMYLDFNIPWNLNIGYIYNYDRTGFGKSNTSQSVSLGGDLSLTEKWKVGFTSGYDFILKGISYTTLNITRDLHCWQMSFNVVPFGFRQSYFFTLSAKSSILQDLKLNKRSPGFVGQPF
jgi:hypothetical protein